MAQITIDETACIRCGKCVDICAIAHVFELTDASSAAVRPESCWNCGQCVAGCPTDAIDHDAFPLEDCPIIERADIPSRDSLIAGFRMRRSQRAFRDMPVDREMIREFVSLGRWAPTASNSQSVDWLAFDDPARIDELSRGTVDEMARFVRRPHFLSRSSRSHRTLSVGRPIRSRQRCLCCLQHDADGRDLRAWHVPDRLLPDRGREE